MKVKKIVACATCVATLAGIFTISAFAAGLPKDKDVIFTDLSPESSKVQTGTSGLPHDTEVTVVENGIPPRTRNVDKEDTITLKRGGTKVYSFNLSGGVFGNDNNAISVVISGASGDEKFQYIFVNKTKDTEIANSARTGSYKGTCSGMNASDTYEITIMNSESSAITLDVSISAYRT